MIILFTDFGLEGPYMGQVKAALYRQASDVPVFDLFSDAPAHNPKASAYLLAAYCQPFPENTVFLAVVDPGVGGNRRALVIEANNRWFVGPDNGLFEMVMRRAAPHVRCWEIIWQPEALSSTFHGRDLFAPIAAEIANDKEAVNDTSRYLPIPTNSIRYPDWPDDLNEVIYLDHFGNAITGLRANQMPSRFGIIASGIKIPTAETFVQVKTGELFCYQNSNGLMEIAVNQGRATDKPGVHIGGKIEIIDM